MNNLKKLMIVLILLAVAISFSLNYHLYAQTVFLRKLTGTIADYMGRIEESITFTAAPPTMNSKPSIIAANIENNLLERLPQTRKTRLSLNSSSRSREIRSKSLEGFDPRGSFLI
jgi:hypothetical protein